MPNLHARRIWKLQAVKVFAQIESVPMPEIRKALGGTVLDTLFSEGFQSHPSDPAEGARMVRAKLRERYGEQMRDVTPLNQP